MHMLYHYFDELQHRMAMMRGRLEEARDRLAASDRPAARHQPGDQPDYLTAYA